MLKSGIQSVLRIRLLPNPDPRLYTLNDGRYFKYYWVNILDNFACLLFCLLLAPDVLFKLFSPRIRSEFSRIRIRVGFWLLVINGTSDTNSKNTIKKTSTIFLQNSINEILDVSNRSGSISGSVSRSGNRIRNTNAKVIRWLPGARFMVLICVPYLSLKGLFTNFSNFTEDSVESADTS